LSNLTLKLRITAVFIISSMVIFGTLIILMLGNYRANLTDTLETKLHYLAEEIVLQDLYKVPFKAIQRRYKHLETYHSGPLIDNLSNFTLFLTHAPPPETRESHRVFAVKDLHDGSYLVLGSDLVLIEEKTREMGLYLFLAFTVAMGLFTGIFLLYLRYLFYPIDCLVAYCKDFENLTIERLPNCQSSEEISRLQEAIAHLIRKLMALFEQERAIFKEAAHELKSPIAVIKARLDLYRQDNEYDKEDFLKDINEDVSALTHQLKEMIFQKSVEYKLHRSKEHIRLPEIVDALPGFFSPMIRQKNLTVTLSHGDGSFVVHQPKEALQRILQTIFENQLNYSPPGSVLTITTDPKSRTLQFENRIGQGGDPELFGTQVGLGMIRRLAEKMAFRFEAFPDDGMFITRMIFEKEPV